MLLELWSLRVFHHSHITSGSSLFPTINLQVRVERPDFLGMREISAKIFIGGLPRDLTDGELKEYFEQFGTLVDHVIIRCEAGCSKGFGFVTFARAESLREVFRNQPYQIKGKTVEVKQAIPKDGTISRLGGSGSSSPYHNPKWWPDGSEWIPPSRFWAIERLSFTWLVEQGPEFYLKP